ncbi:MULTISPECIES: hypothetical protein [unclassified Streptomyces]|uniref:hypothetical protein n=1 Tax=unclassified Streptomyces TaxID=2593676 RepID=UPI0035DA2406
MPQQPHDPDRDQAADRERFADRAIPRPPRPRTAQLRDNWDTALIRTPRQRGHEQG